LGAENTFTAPIWTFCDRNNYLTYTEIARGVGENITGNVNGLVIFDMIIS
jgi:hypothetical protein